MHRDLFNDAYETLTERQKDRYSNLIRGQTKINPTEMDKIFKMLEVGLDQVLYEDLKQSYQNLNVTLNSPIPQLTEAEKEGLYHIYKDKEYFKTLRYPQSDIKEWLEGAANETLEDLGVSYDLKDEVYMLWSE